MPKKPARQRIRDIVDICNLRQEAKLQCNSCIFVNEDTKDCLYKEDIVMYRALKKVHKKKNFKM